MLSNKPQKWKSQNSLKYPIKIIQKPVIDLLAQTLISEKKEEISIFNMRKAKNKKKEKGKQTKIFLDFFQVLPGKTHKRKSKCLKHGFHLALTSGNFFWQTLVS